MHTSKRLLAFSLFTVVAIAGGPTAGLPAAGAVGYDFSNPSSTGCATKGLVDYPATARTYGVWTIRLRRSTTCNTVWAHLTRNDTKKCMQSGQYCARVRITRVRSDGTKSLTALRKTPVGTKAVLSLQLDSLPGAVYTGTAATVSGAKIGASGSLTG